MTDYPAFLFNQSFPRFNGTRLHWMRIMLKGLHKTSKRLADGTLRDYFYAWRGGPAISARPNTPEFVAEFHRHHRERIAPDLGTLAGLVENYKAKELPHRKKKTREAYLPLLESLTRQHGRMPVEAIEELGSRSGQSGENFGDMSVRF